ncbi:MAG: hypothetical protein M0P71_18435 [Melioribacteraceae bacterium]|jgi:hypothetical protein|nr:hypothetical protein [Melioribacteraceae bacterium]
MTAQFTKEIDETLELLEDQRRLVELIERQRTKEEQIELEELIKLYNPE